ncbi:PREDICTED: N-alpha-acetyltransferase 38-B, NatC auxiliary subunit isoform X2 [Trachymyrmex septentrionalis]|uniref:N-alpha-acetyltransferase 38-B, NatC auxiliary subunit isoform X2 n=1 Tax=Trachymyrmex septentrionalis TaxID=34720 RepID=UPI00084F397B|nr:PREDICTED: N-alpha-acetyltransferase 38-B, NatC auxiliary subunit isoform X2 [Trachymyrmex septentrionalis]
MRINNESAMSASMKETVHNLSNVVNNEHVHGNEEAVISEESSAKQKLRSWLNRHLRIEMTDGRVLRGAFLCTDRDANVILGSCTEYLSTEHTEARVLGLVMVPGRHIVSIHLDV